MYLCLLVHSRLRFIKDDSLSWYTQNAEMWSVCLSVGLYVCLSVINQPNTFWYSANSSLSS